MNPLNSIRGLLISAVVLAILITFCLKLLTLWGTNTDAAPQQTVVTTAPLPEPATTPLTPQTSPVQPE